MNPRAIPLISGVFALLSLIALACTALPTPTGTPGPSARSGGSPTSTPKPPGPTLAAGPVDGYIALAPRVLRAGQTEGVAVSLLAGQRPTRGDVRLALTQDGETIARSSGRIEGSGVILLPVPRVPEGSYQLEIQGPGFQDRATLRVEEGVLLFLETDKPIYKPGQTVLMRVLTLDPELKPLPTEVTVEVQDARGIKVFKKVVQQGRKALRPFGMVTLEMPLSTEPNLGVWKVIARAAERDTEVDIRVEEYVLPKYEVTVDLPKDWVLASDPITGSVGAEYTFGKPVVGEVEIVASRYVGTWETFANLTQDIDGQQPFELPPVRFVAGVPGAGGLGNVMLEVTVREKGTGYEEKTTRLLTVAATPVNLQVIAESTSFKPSLPLTVLIVTETPDNQPLDRDVTVDLTYSTGVRPYAPNQVERESHEVRTERGKALLQVEPPAGAVALTLEATSGEAHAALTLEASYSPSGSFIHLEQVKSPQPPFSKGGNGGILQVGDEARFRIHSNRQAANFYYEVIARGKVVFSQMTTSPDIGLTLTPLMAPAARLLVYQILPNSEVAADYIPFNVAGNYPHQVGVGFSAPEVRPGESVNIEVETQGPARVGLVAVDRSVFILAENRLNLQQVFDDLERLYMQPQVELHEARFPSQVTTRGARDTFHDSGMVVMSNQRVPEGKEYRSRFEIRELAAEDGGRAAVAVPAAAVPEPQSKGGGAGLAQVERVRQFFPETWLWTDVTTGADGRATLPVEAPDSITTWVLRAVALSREHGLGIAESQLRVFQPFFLQVDLPYSAIRSEEFPVKLALYNYLDQPQEIFVELEEAGWFDLLDDTEKVVTVGPNDIGGVEFRIRPTTLGLQPLKVTARSQQTADAVIRELLVQPEGVSREVVDNLVLSAGDHHSIDTAVPQDVVEGSARAHLAFTGSYLTQTIEGLEGLLRMPFGCGEQNMILLAPNIFVANYLKETGQLKPEVLARAEHLMITGYQRQLTYRRDDGSFSAFGNSDQEGSLWLTAFVLKTFTEAGELMYIDPAVLDEAVAWILQHQRADGSFEPVGFLHHQELLGGLQGNTALTAYVAIALQTAGETAASGRAVSYLEGKLDGIDDPYTMAMVAYALELGDSPQADAAYEQLMAMAIEDEQGLHWGEEPVILEPEPVRPFSPVHPGHGNRSAAIENTGYATLALLEHGDRLNASRAARWLVSQRNAYGGFDSTQDTVVGLDALTRYAADARFDVDMTVTLTSGSWRKEVVITPDNADVLQIVEVPVGGTVEVESEGKGQVVAQAVRRFNLPEVESTQTQVFQIDVDYGTDQVEVNDLITVSVDVEFNPPEPIEAGMVVLDVSVPTGFAPVRDSIQQAVEREAKLKRYDVAGRKVILYIEDMMPGESLSFQFQAQALYPVRALPVASQAYSYYNPQWKGETISGEMTVVER